MTTQVGAQELMPGAGLPVVIGQPVRSRAFRSAKRHSVLVRILKWAFPILAVALLGLYLKGGKVSIQWDGKTIQAKRIETTNKNVKIIDPNFAGSTSDGGRYTVIAASALQDFSEPDLAVLDEIRAHLSQPNDNWIKMSAKDGVFNIKQEVLDLTNDIVIVTKDGTTARLSSAKIYVQRQEVASQEPVQVDMLNGKVRADSMQLFVKRNFIAFIGNVRVRLRKRPRATTPQQ